MTLRCLVAGGAGFIGRHLCGELLRRGHSVICLDNFSTSEAADLEMLRGNPAFESVEGNVEEFGGRDAEVVFHLASPASPRHYQRLSVETMTANSIGSLRLAESALRNGARMVFASTSEVYGDPLVHPQREDYWGNVNPIGPRACYDESKRFGEALLLELHRRAGLDVRIARIFNTYGPGMVLNDGRAIPEFVLSALQGKPLVLHNAGKQTRSLCFVSDTVAGLIALAEMPTASGEVVNIGNPEEHTVREIAIAVAAAVGVDAALLDAEGLPDDPARRRPDIGKARQLLGWQPEVALVEGVKATVEDFRVRLGAERE